MSFSYVEFLKPVYIVGVGYIDRWTHNHNHAKGNKPIGIREDAGYLYLWHLNEAGNDQHTRVPMTAVAAICEKRARPAEKAKA